MNKESMHACLQQINYCDGPADREGGLLPRLRRFRCAKRMYLANQEAVGCCCGGYVLVSAGSASGCVIA